MSPRLRHLNPKKTLFLLCDVQDKFRPGMPLFDNFVKNATKLTKAGKELEIPLIVSEHYPERLGKTVKDIDISHAKAVISKTRFSMMVPELESKINDIFGGKPDDVVLYGLETKAGKELEIPLIVSEHYPERLGKTVKDIDISHAKAVISKTRFSMMVPELESKINDIFGGKPDDVVLYGLESHICIEQTVIDLLEKNIRVYLVADCICSRLKQDRDLTIERFRSSGCTVTTSESVIFDLMGDKNHPKFDVVRKFVNNPSADMELTTSDTNSKL